MTETDAQEPLLQLRINDSDVSVLGTAHVSKKSAETVTELLNNGTYTDVAIELCDSRYQNILKPDNLAEMNLFQVIRDGKAPMVMASLALGSFQQRIAEQFGIEPGAEMRAAINASKENNQQVHLIDREIGTTLKRVYRSVPWWKRALLFSGLITSVMSKQEVEEEEIEKLKQGDLLESTFGEFKDEAPEIYAPLIDERDVFMANKIYQIVSSEKPEALLAVVGAGHLPGMKKYLDEFIDIQPNQEQLKHSIDSLNHVPKKTSILKFVPWVIVAVVLLGFYLGFQKSPEMGWSLVATWVLINGGLSALGALIAGGHPLTVLGAFVAAPVTSLNPTIGAGMITAGIELLLRKPQVKDFDKLKHDISSASGWWKNRVSRVLLVFFFSTMGSAIGTWIAGARIFSQLSN